MNILDALAPTTTLQTTPQPCLDCQCPLFWRDYYDQVHCLECFVPPDRALVAEWLVLVDVDGVAELIRDSDKHPPRPPRHPGFDVAPPGATRDEWGSWLWEPARIPPEPREIGLRDLPVKKAVWASIITESTHGRKSKYRRLADVTATEAPHVRYVNWGGETYTLSEDARLEIARTVKSKVRKRKKDSKEGKDGKAKDDRGVYGEQNDLGLGEGSPMSRQSTYA